MNFHRTILLDPLSSLFGGGGSSSSSSATNQQVGAEGNAGPVFGAITVKGNSAKSTKTTSATSTSGGATGTPSKGVKKGTATSTGANASGGAPVSSGAGNLAINVTTSDINADNNLTTIAQGSIAAQNDLAFNSIAAQNSLAGAALNLASNISAAGFTLASTATSTAANAQGAALDTTSQALQNFGALYANPGTAGIIASPTGGAAVAAASPTSWGNVLLLGAVIVGAIALFKRP